LTTLTLTGATSAGPAWATPATPATIAAATRTTAGTAAAAWALAPTTTLTFPAVVAVIIVAPTGPLGGAGRQDHRDVGSAARRADHFNPAFDLLGRASRLDRSESEDLNPLEGGVDFGPQDRTDCLTFRHQGAIEDTLGLTGTGGAPGPRPVTSFTGQLNINPARHAADTLPR
jgi:hypothetical protein